MKIRSIIFVISYLSVHARYSLYRTNISSMSYPIYDCLYAYLIDGGKEIGLGYLRNDHLIPYCRRSEMQVQLSSNIAQTISFIQLRKQGVTSQQLLDWYAPIDIAENYEMNHDDDEQVFHNCTLPWFGSICQYRFDENSSISFDEIVQTTLKYHWNVDKENLSGTCYPFVNGCNTTSWPVCLDWREICDGKFDCFNEEDERECEQLDFNQCRDDEYRCHYGGQCIPMIFDKDSRLSIDCLDGSDEQDDYIISYWFFNPHCLDVPTFRCQERIGRYRRSFQCGDGQYIESFRLPNRQPACGNKRDIAYSRAILTSFDYISNDACRQAFRCALYANRTTDTGKPIPSGRERPLFYSFEKSRSSSTT